jgi:myosin heavy subunit
MTKSVKNPILTTQTANNTQQNGTIKPERTLDELKSDASTQLKKILTQGKNIKQFQSNLDLLIQRYHTDDSFFDKVANSYGNLSWWIKLGMITATISIAACIGAVCNLIVVFAVATFVLYSAITLLMENQHSSSLKKDKRISADIIELEASIAESVEHINEIEESLTAVFTSLCEMNLQQAENIAEFKAQIEQLEAQVTRLTEINGQLDSTKEVLIDSTNRMGQVFEKAKTSLSELTDSLSKEMNELANTDDELLKDATLLLNDHACLQQINSSFELSQTNLSNLTNDLANLVQNLKVQAEETSAFNEEACAKLGNSINQTLATTANTDTVTAHAGVTIEDAMKVLNEFQTDKIRTDAQSARSSAEFKQQSSHATSALSRAASILASQNRSSASSFASTYAPLMQ